MSLLIYLLFSYILAKNLDFNEYMAKYDKKYKNQTELLYRKKVYEENTKLVEEINSKNYSYKLSMDGPWADISVEEYKKMFESKRNDDILNKFKIKSKSSLKSTSKEENYKKSVDWSKFMQPIQDQGYTGTCEFFATIAAAEGVLSIHKNRYVKLSEAFLIDMSLFYDIYLNYGIDLNGDVYDICNNFNISEPYNFGITNPDMIKYLHYITCFIGFNFVPKDSYRLFDNTQPVYINMYDSDLFISDIEELYNMLAEKNKFNFEVATISYNEENIIKALQYGPVVGNIESASIIFMNYEEGIIEINDNYEPSTDHAVTIVGYGIENGIKYWKCRNSWGKNWGEDGYFRIERGRGALGLETSSFIQLKLKLEDIEECEECICEKCEVCEEKECICDNDNKITDKVTDKDTDKDKVTDKDTDTDTDKDTDRNFKNNSEFTAILLALFLILIL